MYSLKINSLLFWATLYVRNESSTRRLTGESHAVFNQRISCELSSAGADSGVNSSSCVCLMIATTSSSIQMLRPFTVLLRRAGPMLCPGRDNRPRCGRAGARVGAWSSERRTGRQSAVREAQTGRHWSSSSSSR